MNERTATRQESLDLLEVLPAGVVLLDSQRRVQSMNRYALSVLPVDQKRPFDRIVGQFHHGRSRRRVNGLIDDAALCPVSAPVTATMLIDLSNRILLLKLSSLVDGAGNDAGFSLVFFDVTEQVTQSPPSVVHSADVPDRYLSRIPASTPGGVRFVPVAAIGAIESNAHVTRLHTREQVLSCSLAISELQSRLDPDSFVRVHRRFIVNLRQVTGLSRKNGRLSVLLQGEHSAEIPVSREAAADLRRRLGFARS
jgi:hypothetical protein